MTFIVITMIVCLVLAALVLAYTAYPHRGESAPGLSWLGDVVEKAADSVPVIDDRESEDTAERPLGGVFDQGAGRDRRGAPRA